MSDNYSLIFPGTLLSFLESFTFIYSYSINMFDKTELKTQGRFFWGRALLEGAAGQLHGSAQCYGQSTQTQLLDPPWGTVQKSKSIACLPSSTLTKGGATFAGSRKEPWI